MKIPKKSIRTRVIMEVRKYIFAILSVGQTLIEKMLL